MLFNSQTRSTAAEYSESVDKAALAVIKLLGQCHNIDLANLISYKCHVTYYLPGPD